MLHNQYVIYCMQNKQKKKEEEVKEEVLVSVFEGLDLCLYCPKSTDVDTADNILHITAERGHSKLTQKILDRDNNKRLLWVKNCSRQYPVEVALSTKHEDGSKGKTQHYTTAAVLLRAMNSWYLVIVSCFPELLLSTIVPFCRELCTCTCEEEHCTQACYGPAVNFHDLLQSLVRELPGQGYHIHILLKEKV